MVTSQVATVTVVDYLPPDITCPSNILVNAGTAQCGKSNVTFTVTATDNSGQVTDACAPPSGSTFSRGITTVHCTATDSSGNTNSCLFTVTVLPPVANTAPVSASLPASTKVNTPLSLALAKLAASVHDPDCDPLTVLSVGNPSVNGGSVVMSNDVVIYTPPVNSTNADRFTYTVSDGRGGTAGCSVLMSITPGDGTSGNLLVPVLTAQGWLIKFAGIPRRTYSLQRAPSPTGPWTTIAPVIVGFNGLGQYLDTTAIPPAYYRTTYP